MTIYIYELIEKDGEIVNQKIDSWDNGKFGKSKTKMTREEVLTNFNRGYNFTSETK